MAVYTSTGYSFSLRTNFKLYIQATTTHITGSGTRVDIYSYAVRESGTQTPNSSIATKSMSMPSAKLSDFVTAGTSASTTWTYNFATGATQAVWSYTRYYPYSVGTTSPQMSLTAADGAGGLLGSATAYLSIPLFAQPSPVGQTSSPTISGSGLANTSVSSTQGSYTNYSSITSAIGYNTSGSFSGYLSPSSRKSSPYTITVGDAGYPPYYYAAYDEVLGQDGTTYYFYSGTIVSKFQVSFNANGGNSTPSDILYAAGNSITLPGAISRSGYVFSGWNDGSNTYSAGGSYSPPTSGGSATTATLSAVWTAATYTLYYDANGGSVSPSSKSVTYNSSYGTLATPSRTGYTFNGWFTASSGGSQVTSSTTYSSTSNTTIYAQWSVNSYTLYYDANGGSVSPSSKSVSYGSTYGALPTPTRTGYTFNGWFTASTGGTQVSSSTTYNTEGNVTIFAQWTASIPVFSDQAITTTAILNKDINTNIDYSVDASPVTSYSIIYSGTGLDPTSWLSISKDSGSTVGNLSGKPTQIGTYTFIVRATNTGGGDTDSSLITLTVLPAGKRFTGSTASQLSVAKRFDGNSWVNLKIMRRYDGSTWHDIGNI